MNNNDIDEDIKQLESLKLDRKSFVIGDKEHDEIYLKDIQAIENILAKANRYDRLVERIKEVRNSLEKDGFVGYADELIDILEEE